MNNNKLKKFLTHFIIIMCISLAIFMMIQGDVLDFILTIFVVAFHYVIIYFVINHFKKKSLVNDKHLEDISKNFKYKSEWAFEDAAEEYLKICHKKGIEELTEEENDIIYDYASMPIVYFVMWLIENNFLNEELYNMSDELILKIKNREESPLELIRRIDYCFSSQDVSKEILPFVEEYYNKMYEMIYIIDREKGDYYQCIKNENNFYYCIDFSWNTYNKIKEKINNAYNNYKNNI